MYKTLILHVPHSSDNFGLLGPLFWEKYSEQWKDRAKNLIDWYTDELFVPEEYAEEEENSNIIPVVFDYCRTLCDVERMAHDPLEAKGLGITYYDYLTTEDGPLEIQEYPLLRRGILCAYQEHQNVLIKLLMQNPGAILIDCHSFSNGPTVLQPDASLNTEVDICIGFNDDFSKPDDSTIKQIADCFRKAGYKVGINTPYSNSKTVDTPIDYHSIMIEINKRVYMDENTLKIYQTDFLKLKNCIESVYTLLLKDSKYDGNEKEIDNLALELKPCLSKHMGTEVSTDFSLDVIQAFFESKPAGLGHYSSLGYYAPFKRLLDKYPEYKITGYPEAVKLREFFLKELSRSQKAKLEQLKKKI